MAPCSAANWIALSAIATSMAKYTAGCHLQFSIGCRSDAYRMPSEAGIVARTMANASSPSAAPIERCKDEYIREPRVQGVT